MSKEILSNGSDMVVEQVDRSYAGSRHTLLKVDGSTGDVLLGDSTTGPAPLKIAFAGGISFGGAPELLTGAGAVSPDVLVTLYSSGAGPDALTLADGSHAGQLKIVHHTSDGGSGVLTPATPGNFASFTFTNVHDACLLQWDGAAWNILLNVGGTVSNGG